MQSHWQRTLAVLATAGLLVGTLGAMRAPTDEAVGELGASATRAAAMPSLTGGCLLPPGTTVDRTRWDGGVVEISLTLPAGSNWVIGDTDAITLSNLLATPFTTEPGYAGLRLQVRTGTEASYDSLAPYILDTQRTAARMAVKADEPAEQPLPLEAQGMPQVRGAVTQAARQPAGALSGVTVFVSCGHGWTATDSTWYLQRDVLKDMNEDHGNIDQLNQFVQYAFNAGATVVPFRPVGWQPIEIVLDNDDPGVTYTGSWDNGNSAKYYENGVTNSGIVYKWTSAAASETATARFTPNITVTGYYPVYCFTVAGSNRTLQTYRIKHSGGTSAVTIDHRLVGSGWIWMGDYYLVAGEDNYVEITNESTATGAIVADAIRWGCGVGDIVRPGPGTVSGYSRDEECARYWANSELGNHAVGFSDEIWTGGTGSDTDDNVRTAAKWAREMNVEPADLQTDRWKRIYLEFHTNATDGVARGQFCLITTLGATTYQTQYATTLSNTVDAEMTVLQNTFEHTWVDRSYPTYTYSYGAICTPANGDEFDATIVELAFHDNQEDAELLRDCRVRAAMARACVHGITKFLNSLPGSQVPLAYAPDTPRDLTVVDTGNGNVVLSWAPGLTDIARGDPATGYVVYQSSNGRGFGNPIVLSDVQTTTISGLAPGETRYFRVAATNAGGESMPTEVLAVRRPAEGVANILVVNGFDRLRRQMNPIETFTHPAAYAGKWIERQQWRKSNSYDYIIQHAEALAAGGYGFSSCTHAAVADSYVLLGNYDAVVWIGGVQSVEDYTFTTLEQSKVTTYLNNGGSLFVSGADLAYDLINQTHGTSFAQDTLKFGYTAGDAGTYAVTAAAGSILADVAAFDFDPANGAAYEVREPDVLATRTGSVACLNYSGGTGGIAGVQYTGTVYNAVSFGFPFETISSSATRAAVMERVIAFLLSATGPLPFDYDTDGDVDLTDFNVFRYCFKGPDKTYAAGHLCLKEDADGDTDVDMADFAQFQSGFTGPHQ